MPAFNVWPDPYRSWWWDDVEDHGGYDRNVACGPFESREAAEASARALCDDWANAEAVDGEPWRYVNDP